MNSFKKNKKYDGIYCTVDTFRHLLTEKEAKLHLVSVIKALKKPIAKGIIFGDSADRFPSRRLFAILPKIKGITIRNEKRAALSLLILRSTASAMVDPLREIPGIMATACIKPIKNAFLKLSKLLFLLIRSAR